MTRIGILLGGTSTYEAYMDGDTGLAMFRGILWASSVKSVLGAGTSSVLPTSGGVAVYESINPVTRLVQYIGITNNFAQRAAAHIRIKGIQIRKIQGLGGLSRLEARSVEQVLIEYYGLGKNLGSLINKINGISPKNPIYAQALQRDRTILQQAGYPGF